MVRIYSKPSTHAGAGANYQAANYNQQYYNNYNYGNQQDYTAAYTEYYNNYYNYNNATADTATAANNNNYYTGQEGQQAYEGQKTSAEENDDDEEKPEGTRSSFISFITRCLSFVLLYVIQIIKHYQLRQNSQNQSQNLNQQQIKQGNLLSFSLFPLPLISFSPSLSLSPLSSLLVLILQNRFGEWTVVTTRIVSDDEEEDDDEENEGDTKKKIKKEGEKAKSRKRKQEER